MLSSRYKCLVDGVKYRLKHTKRFYSSDIKQEVEFANKKYAATLEIRCDDERKGYGLFATRDIKSGELVMTSKAIAASTIRDSHSVQTGWNCHVQMDLPARFINHCCDANVGIKDNKNGAFDFFAIKDVKDQSEIVWDYETSEYEIVAFDGNCLCGSPKCRGKLKGFKHHGEEVKQLYTLDFCASYLKTPYKI
jgi:uncharacterized protein